jgi:hypothetical protein
LPHPWCAEQSALEGTCVESFFQTVRKCFNPAGCCVGHAGQEFQSAAWASGAYADFDPSFGEYVLLQNGAVCAKADLGRWTAWDGTTLTVDYDTGIATCADGTQYDVGSARVAACPQALNIPDVRSQCIDTYPGDAGAGCCTPYQP